MKLYSVLVTGANKGIGFEFVKQLVSLPESEAPEHVFATYRNVETRQKLKAIRDDPNTKPKLYLIKVDVTKKSDLESAKGIIEDIVGDEGLTLLINNAGIAQLQSFPDVTEENMNTHFVINTVGPVLAFQTMLPLLLKAADNSTVSGMSFSRAGVLNMTSMAGSITRTGKHLKQDIVATSYKVSKAAVNMAMKVAAETIKDKNILVVNMCPGWVKTEMGGPYGEIESEESISQMLKTIGTMNEENHGSFVDRFGNVYPY